MIKTKKLLVMILVVVMLLFSSGCGNINGDDNYESSDNVDVYEKSNYGENIEILTEKEKEYLLCDSFVCEVNSGGFESYFTTDYASYCTETADHLEKNGSVIYSKILREAIALFPESFDFSSGEKVEEYLDENEELLEKFDELDSLIYDSDEDIDSILMKLEQEIYNDR